MRVVEIPLLTADQTPEEAIDRMNAMDSRVVSVRDASGDFRLIRNVDALRGWQRGAPTLADLQAGEYIDPLPGIHEGQQTRLDALQIALNTAAVNYGIAEDVELLDATMLSVWIGTRNEGYILSPQRFWRCKNPCPHSGTIPPDICPAVCPRCGYPVKCG